MSRIPLRDAAFIHASERPPYVRRDAVHGALEQGLRKAKGPLVIGDNPGFGVTRTLMHYSDEISQMRIDAQLPTFVALDLAGRGYMQLAPVLVTLRNEVVATIDSHLRLSNVEADFFDFDMSWAVWKQLTCGRQDHPPFTYESRFRKLQVGGSVKIFTLGAGELIELTGLVGDAASTAADAIGQKALGAAADTANETLAQRSAKKIGTLFYTRVAAHRHARVRALIDVDKPDADQIASLMAVLLEESLARVQHRLGRLRPSQKRKLNLVVDAIDEFDLPKGELTRLRAALCALRRSGEKAGFHTVLAGRGPARHWLQELNLTRPDVIVDQISAKEIKAAWSRAGLDQKTIDSIIKRACGTTGKAPAASLTEAWRHAGCPGRGR